VDVTELEADLDAVCDDVAVIVPDLEAVFDCVFVFEGVFVADFV